MGPVEHSAISGENGQNTVLDGCAAVSLSQKIGEDAEIVFQALVDPVQRAAVRRGQ